MLERDAYLVFALLGSNGQCQGQERWPDINIYLVLWRVYFPIGEISSFTLNSLLFFLPQLFIRYSALPLYHLMKVIKALEWNSLGNKHGFWGHGLSVSAYFWYGVFPQPDGEGTSLWPVPDGYPSWNLLLIPGGPITRGLFSILILIWKQLQFFKKKKKDHTSNLFLWWPKKFIDRLYRRILLFPSVINQRCEMCSNLSFVPYIFFCSQQWEGKKNSF